MNKHITLRIKVLAFLAAGLLAGCDLNENDADRAGFTFNNEPAYLRPRSSGFIDLNSRIVTPEKVRIEVSGTTSKGRLTDLGGGLLQYAPSQGNSLNDSFRFTVFDANNQVMDSDTMGIIVTSDTTNRPCALAPFDDYRYNVTGPVTVDVRINDAFCKGTHTLSIHQPDNTFPPFAGTATVVEDRVVYTPGPSYTGTDRVIYKLTSSDPSIAPAYGILYLTSGDICIPTVANDSFQTKDQLAPEMKISIDVISNDKQCDAEFKQLAVYRNPKFGKAAFSGEKLIYTTPATISQYPFVDSLIYSVQNDGQIVTGRVTIRATGGQTGACDVVAKDDYFDLTTNTEDPIDFDVLNNDTQCDSVVSIEITKPPVNGVAKPAFGKNAIRYSLDVSVKKNDSLEYKICGLNGACSTAKVRIKRQP